MSKGWLYIVAVMAEDPSHGLSWIGPAAEVPRTEEERMIEIRLREDVTDPEAMVMLDSFWVLVGDGRLEAKTEDGYFRVDPGCDRGSARDALSVLSHWFANDRPGHAPQACSKRT